MPSEEERIPHKTKPNQTKQKQKQQKKIGQFWGRNLEMVFLFTAYTLRLISTMRFVVGKKKKYQREIDVS